MRAAEAGKPDEEKLVLTPEQIERLHHENRLWRVVGGNKTDAILTPPDEKGKGLAWRFDPADLRPDLGELKARYRPEVWKAWEKWAKATPVDPLGKDARTVWDWASAKKPRAPRKAKAAAAKPRAANLTEALVRAGISRTGLATLGKIQALRAALKHQSPTTIDASIRSVKVEGGQYARSLEASWKAHVNDFLQYVDPDLVKDLPQLDVVITAKLNALGQYSPAARKVTLNADHLAPGQMARDTVWHEFTHWLHMHAPEPKRQALADWFTRQTAGQRVQRLRDGGDGIPDDLLSPERGDYAGRIYPFERQAPRGLEVPTTRMEVLSRSDEELLDHWNFISPTTGRYAWRESFLETLNLLFQ
jgi:hypothetical protein